MSKKKKKKKRIEILLPVYSVALLVVAAAFIFVIFIMSSGQHGNNGESSAVAVRPELKEETSVVVKDTSTGATITTTLEQATEQVTEAPTKAPETEVVRNSLNLPTIYINTENGAEINSKYTYINATFSMSANGVEGFEDVAERGIRIRGRGHSTWKLFPKKSYKMNFNEKLALMGDEKDKDWLLISNYYDRSLTRNDLALHLAKKLEHLKYTPDSYPVEVYLNGEYYGVYDLCEQIEVAGGRVDISRDENNVDGGYLLEVGGDATKVAFNVGLLNSVEIRYPKNTDDAHLTYIANYVKAVNDLIVTGQNIDELVDVDSLIDWLILMEFTYNWDASFTRNVFMYKEAGGKLAFGPAWDFDFAMGSFGYDDADYQSYATTTNGLVGTNWITYLLDNPEFKARFANRWLEVRDILMAEVDSFLDKRLQVLAPYYENNYQRWMLPVDGQNIRWEWETEYTQRDLAGLYGYLQGIFDKRYSFLNKALFEGYEPPRREQEVFPH